MRVVSWVKARRQIPAHQTSYVCSAYAPWCHELICAQTSRYVGKVLHIKAGHALSLQYHQQKDETVHVWSGKMRSQSGEGEELLDPVLEPGDCFHITPGLLYRMIAVTDYDILEASTPELDDVVRLEDRYSRK